jgi:hypothetical protein
MKDMDILLAKVLVQGIRFNLKNKDKNAKVLISNLAPD